jgi:SAM-dependent methyltransferase
MNMALEGSLDFCTSDLVGGWAWDSEHPERRVTVEIRVDEKPLAQVAAERYREDLKKNGIGDGFHAYWCRPPSSIDPSTQKISVIVAGTHVALPRSNTISLPTEDMIFLVSGGREGPVFLATGSADRDKILEVLSAVGFDIMHDKRRVLDWGCGCGRIARHWEPYVSSIELFGCDLNEPSVRWCRDNIPFGTFAVCGLRPPLPYPDGYFDVVYGISVLTHLMFDTHYLWMQEIWRLLRAGGVAVLTAHGPSILPIMLAQVSRAGSASVEVTLVDEEVFLCNGGEEGTNHTGSLETYGAFAKIFYPFKIQRYRPRNGLMGIQDTYVLAKKSNTSLNYLQSLAECDVDGAEFRADIELQLRRQRHLAVLASAKNLSFPAAIRLGIHLPDLDGIAAVSQWVDLPERVDGTNMQAAFSMVTIEDIPEADGPAHLSVEVRGTQRMNHVQLHLRNAVLF